MKRLNATNMRIIVAIQLLAGTFGLFAYADRSNGVAVKSRIGAPCERQSDCGSGHHCIIEQKKTREKARFAGGYCVQYDCSYLDPCEVGAKCVNPQGTDFNLCLAACSDDTHCRNGYMCYEDGVCLPAE